MKITPIQIHFFPKKKTASTRFCLYMRISLGSERCDISLKYDLDKSTWDAEHQKLKVRHPDSARIQGLMNQYRVRALTIYQSKIQQGLTPQLQEIREELTGKGSSDIGHPMLTKLFLKIIDRKKVLSGENNSAATIQKYSRCLAHIKLFLKIRFEKSDIRFDELNLAFIEDFEVYLKTDGKCQHNSAMKYIQTLRGVFKHAFAHGYVKADPFAKYKIRLHEVHREFLTQEEITRLSNVVLPSDKLNRVRDFFVFSCYTGLAYADIQGLTFKQLHRESGRYWIRTRRQKTHVLTNIPLLEVALQILMKYNPDLNTKQTDEKLLPIMSNQKTNDYLKIIAIHCGISKTLTFHIARHSFATSITLSNGVPIESVSAMLGHKRIVTTQHYAKMIDKKLEEDMNLLEERLALKSRSLEALK